MADDRDNPIHRVVPADGAPPVGRGGSPFDVLSQFGRQPEPSEPSEPNEPPKRRGAPNGKRKKAAAPTPTRAHGTQFQVACVLLTAGEEGLHRDAVADRLEGVAMKVLANALTNMKSAGRVERVGGTQWRLTDKGRQWATGGCNLMNQRAAGAKVAEGVTRPRKIGALTPRAGSSAQLVPVRPSFRCWIDSNGTFVVEKAGQKVELELAETRQMLRYLDAVGEELIAAAEAARS